MTSQALISKIHHTLSANQKRDSDYCNYSVIKELLNQLNFAVNIYLVSTLPELFVSAVFFASRLFGP